MAHWFWETFTPILAISYLFVLPRGRQTNGQTGGRKRRVLRPIMTAATTYKATTRH